jgi:hypothetical protein
MPHSDSSARPINHCASPARTGKQPDAHEPAGATEFPLITAVMTAAPCGYSEYAMPHAIYGELDPINVTAASLYRAVVDASVWGTRPLDIDTDVIQQISWFHNWSDRGEALDAILVAAALLEQHGWMIRERLVAGAERWTPLGRDRPRLTPDRVAA